MADEFMKGLAAFGGRPYCGWSSLAGIGLRASRDRSSPRLRPPIRGRSTR
ncbi:hypothetical protein ACFQH2_11620 [Natronoarchaeum sp. GCM10025703]